MRDEDEPEMRCATSRSHFLTLLCSSTFCASRYDLSEGLFGGSSSETLCNRSEISPTIFSQWYWMHDGNSTMVEDVNWLQAVRDSDKGTQKQGNASTAR